MSKKFYTVQNVLRAVLEDTSDFEDCYESGGSEDSDEAFILSQEEMTTSLKTDLVTATMSP